MTAVLGVKHNSDCSQMLNTESLLGSKDFCKLAFNILIERHASLLQRNQSKWKSDFQAHGAEMIDWSKSYSLLFLCTHESKLQIFQFKLLHRRISTNRYLFKIGLISSELCFSVKVQRKPSYVSSENVFKSKFSGMKLKTG